MKTTLTPEEERLIPVVRESFLSSFFSLPRLDPDKVKDAYSFLYKVSGLDEPEIILLDSPMSLQYMVNYLKILYNILNEDQVWSQVQVQVGNQVRVQVGNQVRVQVGNQVANQVQVQVRNQVENQVWDQVGNQVRVQVGNQIENQVGNQVGNQILNQVNDQLENQVGSQIQYQIISQILNQLENQIENQVGNQILNQVNDQLENQVGTQIQNQILNQVGKQVGSQIKKQILNQLENQIENQVGNQVLNQVLNQLRMQIGTQVGAQIQYQVNDQVRSQVRSQVGNKILNQVRVQVGNQVGKQVGSQIKKQILNQVGNKVKNQIGDQVKDQVNDQVSFEIKDQIEYQILDQVNDQVGTQIKNQIKDLIPKKIKPFSFGYYGDLSDFGWISFYSYFKKIGLIDHDQFNMIDEHVHSFGFTTIQFKKICFVSQYPIFLSRDSQNRLHNTDRTAVEFADGYQLHYVHGIYFTPQQFNQYITETPSYSDLNAIGNVEMRTAVLIEKMDVILQNDPSVKLISEDTEISSINGKDPKELPRKLYSFLYLGEERRAILLYCHSVNKPNIHLVPRSCNTPQEAVTWMNYGISDFKYQT